MQSLWSSLAADGSAACQSWPREAVMATRADVIPLRAGRLARNLRRSS